MVTKQTNKQTNSGRGSHPQMAEDTLESPFCPCSFKKARRLVKIARKAMVLFIFLVSGGGHAIDSGQNEGFSWVRSKVTKKILINSPRTRIHLPTRFWIQGTKRRRRRGKREVAPRDLRSLVYKDSSPSRSAGSSTGKRKSFPSSSTSTRFFASSIACTMKRM